MNKKFNQYGFTLVEIMAVVGMIAILSTVAFPRYTILQKHYSLYSTAKKLVADMNYARQVAIDQNKNYAAQINTDSYMIGTNSTSFPAGIMASGNFTFNFNYLGIPSPSGQFNLYNANNNSDYYTIEVAATGRVTLIEGVPVPQLANADLSSLTMKDPSSNIIFFNPAFGANITSYTANVANSVDSVTVTPAAADPNATITVNSITVASGLPSSPISLALGDNNTITIVVTAKDGTTNKTYTVTVNRAMPSDANLSNLTLSSGTLNPVFAPGTTSYAADVACDVTNITVTPTADDPTATIRVNGTVVGSGQASDPINLIPGSNTITVTVTAGDGVTNKTYTVTVTRAAKSNDANLSNLTLSSGSLTPQFDSGTTSYTASVTNDIASITVTPTVEESHATVTVNGASVTSGQPSGSINLNPGSNTITVTVTAEDGITTKTYTVTVTRVKSSDANLNSLTLSSGTLIPPFTPSTTSYNTAVGNAVTSITVTPTVEESHASVTVNGTSVNSGWASAPINLVVGNNTITLVVTAEDGVTTKIYTVTVTRASSNNANLSNLVLSNGALNPSFSSGTASYSATVANSVNSITVTPTAADSTATIKVNGTAVASGSPSGPVTLAVGDNTITVLVTAQDGVTTKTYTVTVHRKNNDASLSSLTLSSGTLSPPFAPGTTDYTASVDKSTASITVTPTVAESHATVTVNGTPVASGQASAPINLNIGNNTITVVVTAEDGNTNTYTVVVNRSTISSRPEDYVLYIGSVIINNSATVTGDILIGNGSGTVTINNNSEFYGNVYVNTNLTVNNNADFGAPGQPPIQVLVKGSAVFNNNNNIYGDLLYEGSLVENNHLYVTGLKRQQTVQIPQVNLPALKPDNWYAANGYTIINDQSTPVTLADNGKYFFKSDYSFNNGGGANNIIIAGKGSLTFNNDFNASGVIFAPNGNITFNNKCTLTGFAISQSTNFNNNVTLIYQPYAVLPY